MSKGPGNVPESFVAVTTLVEDFLALEREEFLAKHPHAMLLVDNPGEQTENASFQTLSTAGQADKEKLLNRLGTARWAFLLKREPNKFASMVTIGRAAGSGMRLNVPSVSKFHAYLTHVARDSCWYLADANSSNGTFIDGTDLPPSHGKVALKSGSMLRFGPDVTAQFFDAAGIWTMLHQRLAETPDGAAALTRPRRADDGGSGSPRG